MQRIRSLSFLEVKSQSFSEDSGLRFLEVHAAKRKYSKGMKLHDSKYETANVRNIDCYSIRLEQCGYCSSHRNLTAESTTGRIRIAVGRSDHSENARVKPHTCHFHDPNLHQHFDNF